MDGSEGLCEVEDIVYKNERGLEVKDEEIKCRKVIGGIVF